MYTTSQFCLQDVQLPLNYNQPVNIDQQKNSQTKNKTGCTVNDSNNKCQSNSSPNTSTSYAYRCEQCKNHIELIKNLKQQQIRIDYEYQKQKIEYNKLKREKDYLINLKMEEINKGLLKNNSTYYCKQDLENELSQAKYQIQLFSLSLSKANNPQVLFPKQSKKQSQFLIKNMMQKQRKYQDLLMQNMKLQEIIMMKDKIIQQKGLFPLYHYDERILMLRKGVDFWYKKAQQCCFALKEQLAQVKSQRMNMKKQMQVVLRYQRSIWENQLKNQIAKLYVRFKGNGTSQEKHHAISHNNKQHDITNSGVQLSLQRKEECQSSNQNQLISKNQSLLMNQTKTKIRQYSSSKGKTTIKRDKQKDPLQKAKCGLLNQNNKTKCEQNKPKRKSLKHHKCSNIQDKQTKILGSSYNCQRCQGKNKV